MKKIIAILLILILGFTFSGYSSITFMASETDEEITENPVTEEPIEDEPIEEIEEPPIDNPDEKIETKTYNYISETENARLYLKTDNTCVLEMINADEVVYATVNGVYEVLEDNKIEIYVYVEEEKELFGTFTLNEEDMSFDWYEEIEEPPVVDEPEEKPTDENGEPIEDEEGYVKSFLSEFFEENVANAIIRIVMNLGIDIGVVVYVIVFMKKISDKYNSARTTLENSSNELKNETNTLKSFISNELPALINGIQENKDEVIEMINQGKEIYETIKTSTEETIQKNIEKVKEFNDNVEYRTKVLEEGIDMVVEVFKVVYANNPTLVEKRQAEAIANMVNEYEQKKESKS